MQRRTALALLAIFCLAAMPAAASTFLHMSTRDLVTQADALVRGRVVALESSWSDSGRVIVTDATIEVERTLLGSAPATVTVRTFGGQVDDVIVEAHGFPRFEQDEHVLLYLEADDDGTLRVLGYQQGHFRVVTRLDGVTLAVPMVEDGVRFFTAAGQAGPEPRSVEIGTFVNRVRGLALAAPTALPVAGPAPGSTEQ